MQKQPKDEYPELYKSTTKMEWEMFTLLLERGTCKVEELGDVLRHANPIFMGNTVAVHIKNLRSKLLFLGKKKAPFIIKNHPGFGEYILVQK